jgi:hypothetical protein
VDSVRPGRAHHKGARKSGFACGSAGIILDRPVGDPE